MIENMISYPLYDEESIKNIDYMNVFLQISIFKTSIFQENKELILDSLSKNKDKIKVIHLPIDCLSVLNVHDLIELIDELSFSSDCQYFVIHPNKGIIQFTNYFLRHRIGRYNLSIETFQWRKKKELRSPLNIYEICLQSNSLSITFDTSHVSDVWFNHEIIPFLLSKISVIHLSNRIGKQQHLPFNIQNGDLNLVSFVRELKYKYKWYGYIVLEYMKQHSSYLHKNLKYLDLLLK